MLDLCVNRAALSLWDSHGLSRVEPGAGNYDFGQPATRPRGAAITYRHQDVPGLAHAIAERYVPTLERRRNYLVAVLADMCACVFETKRWNNAIAGPFHFSLLLFSGDRVRPRVQRNTATISATAPRLSLAALTERRAE